MGSRMSRRRLPVFAPLFSLFAIALVVWLAAGFAPAVARAVPGIHHGLHEWGGDAHPAVVRARGVAFEPARIRIPSGGTASVRFVNADPGVRHNIAVYAGSNALFAGKVVAGPAVREYSFPAPPAGTYVLRCDVHAATTGFVEATGPPAARPGAVRALARNVADASHASEPIGEALLDYAFGLLNLGLGLFLVRRRPRDVTARFFGVAMLGTAAAYNLQGHTALTVIPRTGVLLHQLWHPFAGIAYLYALVVFPDGRLVPRLSRPWARRVYAVATLIAVAALMSRADLLYPEPGAGHAAAFVEFFGLLVPAVGMVSQLYRMRRATNLEERQRSRLLAWALTPSLCIGLVWVLMLGQGAGGAVPAELPRLAFRVFQPVFALIPIALVVGILRYRLWDIDVVVRRAVVFGALAAFIFAVYTVVVVVVGGALGSDDHVVASIAAMTVVAVAFEPVRERVHRVANRLVYGERATPYEVLAGLSHAMSEALSVSEVLPRMAEAAAKGVGAARARVRVVLAAGGERWASWPDADGPLDSRIPVVSDGEPIGEIAVGKRPGDAVTAADRRLLAELAAQAGQAMHNVRLTEELRARLDEISWHARELAASRRRLISAEDAARRTLEREISAGVGRQLTSARAALELSERTMAADAGAAVALLDDAVQRADEAQDALRSLSRGFWLPLLTDGGIVAALEAQARKAGYRVTIATSGLPATRFDPHAEAAVYFCCLEALRDAHSRAPDRPVVLTLGASNGWIEFSVSEGSPPDVSTRGISGDWPLRDRVEALGGAVEVRGGERGTTVVSGRVPVQPSV
jgi:signal transduction histidine kinase/plastocyanin